MEAHPQVIDLLAAPRRSGATTPTFWSGLCSNPNPGHLPNQIFFAAIFVRYLTFFVAVAVENVAGSDVFLAVNNNLLHFVRG